MRPLTNRSDLPATMSIRGIIGELSQTHATIQTVRPAGGERAVRCPPRPVVMGSPGSLGVGGARTASHRDHSSARRTAGTRRAAPHRTATRQSVGANDSRVVLARPGVRQGQPRSRQL
jgi:hypothetical protein